MRRKRKESLVHTVHTCAKFPWWPAYYSATLKLWSILFTCLKTALHGYVDPACIQHEDQEVSQEVQLLPTTPAVTTSTTTPTTTPAPPNAALGEGNASSATTLHDHCLCSVGDSCDRCRTVHPVAFATKAELDSLLQRVLDLEVLHLQVLPL